MGFTGQTLNDQDGSVPHSTPGRPLLFVPLSPCSLVLLFSFWGSFEKEGEVLDANICLGTLHRVQLLHPPSATWVVAPAHGKTPKVG